MKLIVVALAFVALAAAAPVEDKNDEDAIVRSEFVQNDQGFSSSFETKSGIKTQVDGQLKTVLDEEKKEHVVIVMRGTYSYEDPIDHHTETINFYADETGYHAEGPSIPVAPAARR